MDTTGVIQRSLGQRVLLHGKYTYSGVVREVEGKWAVLDEAFMHFVCDAEQRQRRSDEPPVFLGSDIPVNLDYVEVVVRESGIQWNDEEAKIVAKLEKTSRVKPKA